MRIKKIEMKNENVKPKYKPITIFGPNCFSVSCAAEQLGISVEELQQHMREGRVISFLYADNYFTDTPVHIIPESEINRILEENEKN